MPILLNNAPQTCVHIAAQTVRAVFRKEGGSRRGPVWPFKQAVCVAVGLEQPAAHFHNRKGQCCGSRGFRDANKIHSGISAASLLYLLTGLHLLL